jgi:hypothetical protein
MFKLATDLDRVVAVAESKSVSLGLRRFETCRITGLFPSEHTLTFIHSFIHGSLRGLTGLSQAVTITDSKSAPLPKGWFETY